MRRCFVAVGLAPMTGNTYITYTSHKRAAVIAKGFINTVMKKKKKKCEMKAIDLVDDVEFGAFDDERDGQSDVDDDNAGADVADDASAADADAADADADAGAAAAADADDAASATPG